MTGDERYPSPAAVEAAIAEAARKAFAVDSSLTVQERIRLEYFHRFLSRVFSERHASDWMLKGGTGMLARVASARTTTDVDIARRSRSLDAALKDLRRLAAIDLGHVFRFEYAGYSDVVDGNQQTHIEGYQVNCDVYIGANKKDGFHVDLVVNVVRTDVVDQIADKVCATLALYSGSPSSREKDLLDLVVLAVTENVGAAKLRRAMEEEAVVRSLALSDAFEIPVNWGARYSKLASQVPTCKNYPTVERAKAPLGSFLDPVLDGSAAEKTGITPDPTGSEASASA